MMSVSSINRRAFFEIVDLIEIESPSFCSRMASVPRNVAYLSEVSQNALIASASKCVSDKIKKSKFIAIIADSIQDITILSG